LAVVLFCSFALTHRTWGLFVAVPAHLAVFLVGFRPRTMARCAPTPPSPTSPALTFAASIRDEERHALAAASMVEVFKKLWSEEWGPRLRHPAALNFGDCLSYA